MKRNLILVLFYLIVSNAVAQPVTSGYYITLANDTIQSALKIPETIFNQVSTTRLYNKIKVADTTGKFVKMKPSSIKGFGFTRKNTEYAFIAKPITNRRSKFFEVISSGNNARLYYYSYYKNVGKACYKKEMFIIEKPVETDLLVKHFLSRRNVKNTLKQFYSNNPATSQLIDSSSVSFWHLKNDLKKIVDGINSL